MAENAGYSAETDTLVIGKDKATRVEENGDLTAYSFPEYAAAPDYDPGDTYFYSLTAVAVRNSSVYFAPVIAGEDVTP